MKVGDKLIYKLDEHKEGDTFDITDDAYYFNKSYEIIDINRYVNKRYIIINELGDKDYFCEDKFDPYYIWDYFYTKEELRLKKLESL